MNWSSAQPVGGCRRSPLLLALTLSLAATPSATAQTATTIQVGSVQLRLGMTVAQVRALVMPALYLHSPTDHYRLGPVGRVNPAAADSMAAIDGQQEATDTSYVELWTVDRTNAPPWGDVATLWFKRGRLVEASVSWIAANASLQGVLFVRQLHRLLTNLQTAGNALCRIQTSEYPQVFPDSLGGEPGRQVDLSCGPRHVIISLVDGLAGPQVNIAETIGRLPTR